MQEALNEHRESINRETQHSNKPYRVEKARYSQLTRRINVDYGSASQQSIKALNK